MDKSSKEKLQNVMGRIKSTLTSKSISNENGFPTHETPNSNLEKDIPKIYKNQKDEKGMKLFGGVCIALFVGWIMFYPSTASINKTVAAKEALVNKVSTTLSVGTLLLQKDENFGQSDYKISHSNNQDSTKIWVWDYAAEDGDYVQILVNGTPIGDAFMIKHKPVELTVPTNGSIQIKGIKDGGGGITYAVRYDLNGTNYFNSAPEGQFNTYSLIKE